ncbi:kinase-like domain-containing protein [Rhizophagus clarus]|uniref:Kinase-like domain-containing protein n=1 Tax=Rhizophagus clarus TaxID=94130 RepID=A0A8H3LBD6_9GLOM|nr:kinase-like domain-containing protein [Rhizophagus clarus]
MPEVDDLETVINHIDTIPNAVELQSSLNNILQVREDLLSFTWYKSLQRLVQVLRDMRKCIGGMTQYNTLQKFRSNND